jgi:hypothetical protein
MKRSVWAVIALIALAGCANPFKSVPTLSEVELAPEAGQAQVVESATQPLVAPAETAPRGRLLGFFKRKADEAKAAEQVVKPAAPQPEVVVEPVEKAAAQPAEPKRKGLWARLRGSGETRSPRRQSKAPKPGAPDYETVPMGVSLPYGRMARVCDYKSSDLGAKVESYAGDDRGYQLYDTKPGATGLRSFYLTGFDDKCARQFTGALVMVSSAETYEGLMFSPARKTLPQSKTDSAYHRLKEKICKVTSAQPCGKRMNKLSKSTVFVSIYERFGAGRWKNILVHDGEVLAMDLKG